VFECRPQNERRYRIIC